MRYAVAVLAFILLALFPAGLLAQEIKSGPQPGEEIPGPFHELNVNGAHAGNPHCLVCEYGLRPVVVVFARGTEGAALTTLLQKLDADVGKYKNAQLRAFAVIFSEDLTKEDARQEFLTRVEKLAAGVKNIVLAVAGPDGPAKYKLTKDAAVTALLYRDLKVEANFAYAKDKMTEKDVNTIQEAVEKLVGAKK
jgi:hypothetical protein